MVFVCGEVAAQLGSDTEGGKDAGSEAGGVDLRRFAGPGEFKGSTLVSTKGGEGAGVAGVGDDVGHGDPDFVAAACDLDSLEVVESATRRSEFGNGSGRRSTPSTIEKIAVVAPMPKASMRTAVTAKPSDFRT